MTTTILAVDLSHTFRRHWHAQASSDKNAAHEMTVEQVRRIADQYDHVAICCDTKGKNWRHDIDPNYKGNREPPPPELMDGMRQTVRRLKDDGYTLLYVEGYEADDVIASFARWATLQGHDVDVLSGDKDFNQLVGISVRYIVSHDGHRADADAVAEYNHGVTPEQFGDYLALMGDRSDNIAGVEGVGPKKSASLLAEFGSVEGVTTAFSNNPEQFTPKLRKALEDATKSASLAIARKLVSMKDQALTDEQCEKVLETKPTHKASAESEKAARDAVQAELVDRLKPIPAVTEEVRDMMPPVMSVGRRILQPLEFTDTQLRIIRSEYASGASGAEFAMLIEVCRLCRLNPLLKQVYFRRQKTKQGDRYVYKWLTMTGIDGFRAKAEETGLYMGQDEPVMKPAKHPITGKDDIVCTVAIYRQGVPRAFVGVAWWSEYVQTYQSGEPTQFWGSKGYIMLSKCAEALGFRKAFPGEFAGLYISEEIRDEEEKKAA